MTTRSVFTKPQNIRLEEDALRVVDVADSSQRTVKFEVLLQPTPSADWLEHFDIRAKDSGLHELSVDGNRAYLILAVGDHDSLRVFERVRYFLRDAVNHANKYQEAAAQRKFDHEKEKATLLEIANEILKKLKSQH